MSELEEIDGSLEGDFRFIGSDGSVTRMTAAEMKDQLRQKYFIWFHQVGDLGKWNDEERVERVKDMSWFWCFDDGMTPEQAFALAKSQGVV